MPMKRPLPRVGMRMVKSAAAVCICLLISLLTQREGMRIYASIAALWCIRPYSEDTKKMALQRISGTAVGSVYGMLAIALEVYVLHIHGTLPGYLLIALLILPVLWTTTALEIRNTSYFSCVVFLSITVTHITDADPWLFVWHRVAETLIGIAVGIGINCARLPRRRRTDTLFVSGVDDVLLSAKAELTAYSQVRLNRLLDDGALFTISTMRTPASVRETLGTIRFPLPIIVMDGAALYDLKNKKFLHANILSKELVSECCAAYERHGVHYFINGILNDILMIYYGELRNEAERDIYAKLHSSPFRNYVDRKYYNQCTVIYLMGIDRTETMQALYEDLRHSGLTDRVKIAFYPSTDYPGYSYIKIYEKSACREAMLEQLKRDLGVTKSVTFGSIDGRADVVLHDRDGNQMVRTLERLFEPYAWKR